MWEAREGVAMARRSRVAHRATATVLGAALCSLFVAADWKIAEPGWRYEFPRDHHAHRDFKTEWWYFTGTLFDADGQRFGYELTFFRHGIRPLAERDPNQSRFLVDDLKFAHFAISDIDGRQFHFTQKMSRGAFGEAGFDDAARVAWIENWSLAATSDDTFEVTASGDFGSLRLHLRANGPPVIHGEDGVSVKAAGEASASHYYSIPRLETTGDLTVGGKVHAVRGETWFDREWSSSQLGRGQLGWDWVSLQWDDGSALMLYQMRLENGAVDPASSGTWIAADGTATHLGAADFQMTATAVWKSGATGARYPVGWRVALPGRAAEFTIKAALDDQELKLGPITYWEGAIDASGSRDGRLLKGRGYLELTGYTGKLSESMNR